VLECRISMYEPPVWRTGAPIAASGLWRKTRAHRVPGVGSEETKEAELLTVVALRISSMALCSTRRR
jgi:hypothetical protein